VKIYPQKIVRDVAHQEGQCGGYRMESKWVSSKVLEVKHGKFSEFLFP